MCGRTEALREISIGEDAHERRGERPVVGPRDEEPSTPSSTRSSRPPAAVTTTPRPRANASITTRPRPSGQDGRTSSVAWSRAAATSAGAQPAVVLDAVRMLAEQRIDDVLPAALADDHESGVRQIRPTTRRQAAASPSMFL